MGFDVPKVVRSPGYDHGHDKESRNGRDVKIDILYDYVRIAEVFREVSDIYRSTGGYRRPPGSILGLMGLSGRRGGAATRPPSLSPNWTRGRGGAPSFLLFSFPFPSLLLLLLGRAPSSTRKGGILLPVGVGLP